MMIRGWRTDSSWQRYNIVDASRLLRRVNQLQASNDIQVANTTVPDEQDAS